MSATARLALVTLGKCYPGLPLRDGDPRLEHTITSVAAAPEPEPKDSERRSTAGATMRDPRRRDVTALIA
jgi:hypothetical protein